MRNFEIDQLLDALSSATGQASAQFNQALPTAPNPFYAFSEQLADLSQRRRAVDLRVSYNFGGIECQHLMQRRRTELDLHAARPDLFAEPPAIVWPPEFNGVYAARDWVSLTLRANLNVLPRVVTFDKPAYRATFLRGHHYTTETILNLYGETVTVNNDGSFVFLTEDEVMSKIREYTDGELFVYSKSNELFHETADAYRLAMRDLRQFVYMYSNDPDVAEASRDAADRLNRDLVSKIDRLNNSWGRPSNTMEIHIEWRNIFYRMEEDAIDLTQHWQPLVVVPSPTVEETPDANEPDSSTTE